MNPRSALFSALCIVALSSLAGCAEAVTGNPSPPFVLEPEKKPAELFGYHPDYTRNIPGFDSENRPYIRSRSTHIHETEFIHTLRDGEWVERDLIGPLKEAYPDFRETVYAGGLVEPRVTFDDEDRSYTFVVIRLEDGSRPHLLLYSTDYWKTVSMVELPANTRPVEHRAGHNELPGPPFLMVRERYDDHPDRWARLHNLYVLQPYWDGDEIVVPEPVMVSDMLVALGQHSGGSPFAATRNGKTHFFWAEVTGEEDAEESPTFGATYDHDTGEVSEPVFVAPNRPANNSHNMPGVVFDSEGYLHVVTGAHHGQSFYYSRSLEANTIDAGWTDPVPVLADGWIAVSGEERGGQTYVSLVCDPDDTLQLVFRHWRTGIEDYPHLADAERDQFAGLAYQRKRKGEDWSEETLLVVPERAIYSIFNQRLAVDRTGRLYLSFSYLDRTLREISNEHRFYSRMVLVSPDGGESWMPAETRHFE